MVVASHARVIPRVTIWACGQCEAAVWKVTRSGLGVLSGFAGRGLTKPIDRLLQAC